MDLENKTSMLMLHYIFLRKFDYTPLQNKRSSNKQTRHFQIKNEYMKRIVECICTV